MSLTVVLITIRTSFADTMSARSSSAAARASWDLDMDVFLVEAMTDQAKAGKRADSGFKKEAWVAVHESMNERFNKELTIQQIKTRVQTVIRSSEFTVFICDLNLVMTTAKVQVYHNFSHVASFGLWLGYQPQCCTRARRRMGSLRLGKDSKLHSVLIGHLT